MAFDLAAATVVDEDFQVHLRLAAQLVDIAEELALIGPDGLAQRLVVMEHGAEAEGKDRRVLKTVGDHTRVVDA